MIDHKLAVAILASISLVKAEGIDNPQQTTKAPSNNPSGSNQNQAYMDAMYSSRMGLYNKESPSPSPTEHSGPNSGTGSNPNQNQAYMDAQYSSRMGFYNKESPSPSPTGHSGSNSGTGSNPNPNQAYMDAQFSSRMGLYNGASPSPTGHPGSNSGTGTNLYQPNKPATTRKAEPTRPAPLVPTNGGIIAGPAAQTQANDYMQAYLSKLNDLKATRTVDVIRSIVTGTNNSGSGSDYSGRDGVNAEIQLIMSKLARMTGAPAKPMQTDIPAPIAPLSSDDRAVVMVFGDQDQKRQVIRSEFTDTTGSGKVVIEVSNRTTTEKVNMGFNDVKVDPAQFRKANEDEIKKLVDQKFGGPQPMTRGVPVDKPAIVEEFQKKIEEAQTLFEPHDLQSSIHNSLRKALVTANNQDKTSGFVFNLNGVPFIRGGHWNQTASGFAGDSFRVSFLRVAEVPEGSTVEDSVNFIDLTGKSQAWSPIEQKELSSEGGVVVQYFSSSLQTDKGLVTISAMISNKVLQTSEGTQTSVLTPFRLKYNIEVDNFGFQSDNSHLVILKRVDTMDVQGAYNGSIATTNGGKFQWSESVLVDDQILKVGVMSAMKPASDQNVEDESEDFDGSAHDTSKFMAFDVGRGAKVVWDPSLNLQEDMYASAEPVIDYSSYGFTDSSPSAVTVYNGQSSTVMNGGLLPQASGSNNNMFTIVGLVGVACLSMF